MEEFYVKYRNLYVQHCDALCCSGTRSMCRSVVCVPSSLSQPQLQL